VFRRYSEIAGGSRFGFGVVEVSDEGWAYNLHPVGSEELVAQSSFSANAVFRRYSRGPDEARAFSTAVPR